MEARSRRTAGAWALAFASMAAGAIASADSETPVHVDYSTAPGCPDVLAFAEQLRSRVRVRFVQEREQVRTLAVRIQQDGDQVVGRLTFRDNAGAASDRTVTGASCDEVVAGLALVAAVALKTSDVPSRENEPLDAGASLDAPIDAAPPLDAPPDAAQRVLVVTDARAQAELPDATAKLPWTVSAGADVELVSEVSPQVQFAVPIYVELSRAVTRTLGLGAHLRFVRASSADLASFTWTVGGLDLCPLVWASSPLRLQGCVRSEAGVLEVTGIDVVPARSATRPWWSLGPNASFSWTFAGSAYLRLDGALAFPIVRDSFFVQPNTLLFRTPAVGWSAAIGLGANIW